MKISTRSVKQGVTEIFPKFILKKSSDLMIRGGDFYAVWREDLGLWSTEEQDVIDMVDRELYNFTEERRKTATDSLVTKYMWDSDSGSIDSWHKYCQKRMRDNFHPLDEKIIFGDTETTKTDYASKNLVILCENVIYQGMKNSFQPCILQKKDIRLNGRLALSSRVIQSISRNSWFCMVLQELVNPLS